jgi:ClpP class serine protease
LRIFDSTFTTAPKNSQYSSFLSKRTLTPFKKVTSEDLQKSKQDIEDVFNLFRDFVAQNRPQLNIDKVATGETWFGTSALELNLCTLWSPLDIGRACRMPLGM